MRQTFRRHGINCEFQDKPDMGTNSPEQTDTHPVEHSGQKLEK